MPVYQPQPLKGLKGLSEQERKNYIDEQVALGKLSKDWTLSQADRLYKNQQFVAEYGPEYFDKNSEKYLTANERDSLFDYNEYSKAIISKYGNDSNFPYIGGTPEAPFVTLTLEGMKDFWDSGVLSPEELKEQEDALNSLRKSNEQNKFTPKNKFLAALLSPTQKPSTNISVGDAAEALKYSRGLLNKEEAEAFERKYNNKLKEQEDFLHGTISTGLDDEDVDNLISQLYKSNRKRAEDFAIREDNRVLNLPAVKEETDVRKARWHQDVLDGKLTYQEIEDEYKKLFDNDVRKDGAGSRYYTGYKNRTELSAFDVDDMIEKLAQFSVLSEAYGDSAKAMQTIDSGIFKQIKDNEGFWLRRWRTLEGVGAKANAMLANEILDGYIELYHSAADNPAEYRIFKTAEKDLTSKGIGFLFNPNYWNYVDQYVVWSPDEIQRINENGGIGGRVNLYSPNGKMSAEQFVDEGFKMLGYMLPAVALTAATKNVPRGSTWARVLSAWEVGGSAAALGSAYSSGTYNKITLEADQALNEMFNDEAGDFIKQYYDSHPDYIENYLKQQGLDENSSSLFLINAQQQAYHNLYEDAKEAYFNQFNEPDGTNKKREAYREAEEQKLKDAKLGATADMFIETARMLVAGSLWGKWTKSKLTRDLANKGFNPIELEEGVAKQAITRASGRKREVGITVLSGGVDNWLDDITAGIGEGLGLGDYNNWLGSQYGPNGLTTGSVYAADIIDGFLWGRDGAIKALHDPQTWIDGAIGTAGTILGTRVNAITLIRDAIKGENAFSQKGSEAREKWMNENSAWQRLDRYVTNGAITSAAAADERYSRTVKEVERINNVVIPGFREDIMNLGNMFNEEVYFNDIAQEIIDAKDGKQMAMVKSAVRMLAAYEDPVLSQLPEVQKFADFMKRGKDGNFTYDELQTFINDPNNLYAKNATDEAGNSLSEDYAREAMQHNIKKYLQIFDKYEKLKKRIDRNVSFSALPIAGKTQIAVQLLLRDEWKDRLNMMQESLGTRGTEKAAWNYDAEFGSKKGRDRALKSLENLIERDRLRKLTIDQVVKEKKEIYEKAVTTIEEEAARKEYFDAVYVAEALREQIKANADLLKEKANANVIYDEDGNTRTLSKEEIMRLSPKQRAKMLAPENRRDYNEAQRRILDELADDLKNHINSEGKTQDLLQVALDAGIMQERYENSNTSIKKVVKSPLIFANYIERLQDRRDAMLAQAALQDIHDADLGKLEAITNSQEAIDVIFRGADKSKTINRGFAIAPYIVKEFLQKHPEAKGMMAEALEMVRIREDLFTAADSVLELEEATPIKETIASATRDANNGAEVMSAVEDLIDLQTDSRVKLQYDKVLAFMEKIGHQRDATKLRNRELEREKRRQEEAKRLEEEAKKDGKNYDWDGYKVGDTVYSKETGNAGTVVGFEKASDGKNKMLVQVKYADGTTGIGRYDSTTSKDKFTKEQPTKEIVASVTEIPEEPPIRDISQYTITEVEDVALSINEEGATESPSAEQQASAEGTVAGKVPERDITDQGNTIEESDGIISGNRWVTYSISSLKEGVVKEEIPENNDSIYGRVFNWLKEKGIKLQEIIDNEFSRMLADNPNLEIQFMTIDPSKNSKLQKVLFPVVKLTDAMREKYHDMDRGGIIQANGESWLIVGTSGFDSNASAAQREAMDAMRAPINQRRNQYFSQNREETYYVDPVAKTKVQSTTSGRIVNQAEGAAAPRLKKVSELLASAKMSLKQAQFGVQTSERGEKGFATTNNVKDKSKVFYPRNVEDNRGRTFILIDTANGNKIPGMIEPTMLNDIPEESKLRDIIDSLLATLASTDYEVRAEAIKQLCGYLVLSKTDKNILIGKEGANVLTIRRRGFPDISQQLGANFDLVKFLDDVKATNFQINISLRNLNDPVMLKIYDDANALMTTVDSMRTVGMSYNLYMTDAQGNPIIVTPAYNPKPGTGKTEFKTYRSVIVNNTRYTLENGQFVNKSNGNKVNPGTTLEQSCYYNLEIQEAQRSPFYSKGNKQYFQMPNGDSYFVLTRDTLGNIEILDEATAMEIFSEIEREREERERNQNLQEVILDETPAEQPKQQQPQEVQLTQEQVAAQEFGDFSTPTEEQAPTPQPAKEIVTEAKETQSISSKEAVSDMGTKSLEELQKSKNSYTFDDIISNIDYIERVYDILGQKDWGITGNLAKDADILKSKGISVVGITNVEDWINLIRDCK